MKHKRLKQTIVNMYDAQQSHKRALSALAREWRHRAYKSNSTTMSGLRQRDIFNWCALELETFLKEL